MAETFVNETSERPYVYPTETTNLRRADLSLPGQPILNRIRLRRLIKGVSLSLSSWILLSWPLLRAGRHPRSKGKEEGGHDDGLVHFLKNLDIFVYCKVKNYYPWINVKVTSGALINGRRVCVCKLNIITKTNVPTLSTIGGFLPLPPLHPAFGEYSSG